jgi:hypothetical protein
LSGHNIIGRESIKEDLSESKEKQKRIIKIKKAPQDFNEDARDKSAAAPGRAQVRKEFLRPGYGRYL